MRTPLLMWLLALVVACSHAAEHETTPAVAWPGTHSQTSATMTDCEVTAPDGSPLSLRIRYPTTMTGSYPLVIHSHGLGGSRSGYGFLGEYWAEHGYIVIHVDHPGSGRDLISLRDPNGTLRRLRAAIADPATLRGRPRLISTVIDALDPIVAAVPALADHIDRTHIAVTGHSYGAYTAMMIAGMRLDLPRAPDTTADDPRVTAIIALSPQGTGPAFDRDAWSAITRPVLLMTGDRDTQPKMLFPHDDSSGEWRAEPFALMPAGDKWLGWITDATHGTFAAKSGTPKIQMAAVQATTLAFLDRYLSDDAAAAIWLREASGLAFPDLLRCESR
jgi:predicted dienelactone hydrolase